MLRNIFIFILTITFTILIALYSYKILNKPKIETVPLNNSKQKAEHSIKSTETIDSNLKDEIKLIVEDYIINHPNTIIASVENMQKKKSLKSGEYITENRHEIENAGNPPILGNNDGDISIVIFYDYNCSYCKKSNVEINKLIDLDKNIKVILRPIDILGDASLYAAKASLAIHKISKEKFFTIHNDMMQLRILDKASIEQLIEKYALDLSIVENEINSYTIKKLIATNCHIARSLNVSGAPTYIINGVFVTGFITEDKFKQIISQIRDSQKSVTDETKTTLDDESSNEPKR